MKDKEAQKEISKNEFLRLTLMQFDNLRKYIAAKTEEEKIKIREERVKIKQEILNVIS